MDEVWKDIVGYEGLYQISSLGRVKRLAGTRRSSRHSICPVKERILSPHIDSRGRIGYSLSKEGKQQEYKAAILLLTAFVGPRPKGMECCHYDDNSSNNTLSNLRWDTKANNIKDMFRNNKVNMHENHPRHKLNWVQVNEIKCLLNTKMRVIDIARKFNIGWSTVWHIKLGHTWNTNKQEDV